MTPLVISLLIATQTPTPQDVLKRLSKYIAHAHTFSADIALTSPSIPTAGVSKFIIERPNKVSFTIKWANLDYKFVGNSHGHWDADNIQKIYDESDQWGFWYPESNISSAPTVFTPGFLMDGTLGSDRLSVVRYVGKSTVNGMATDQVEGKSKSAVVDIFVAADGRPVRYVVNHGGKLKIQADIKNLVLGAPVAQSAFGSNPPLGFVEHSVPLPEIPAKIGSVFPTKGWRAKGGATLQAMFTQKPTLVVVTEAGCTPSEKSATSVANISRSGSLNVAVATLSASGGVPPGLAKYPLFYDAEGNMARQINAPGTPLFYLVGKDGKVMKIWSGYDPDRASAFEKDVITSLKPDASE